MSDPIIPQTYHIAIEPDLKRFTFAGRMCLAATAQRPTDTIRLDCAELAIWRCAIKLTDSDAPAADCRFSLDPAAATLSVHPPAVLSGSFELTIIYCGKINDRMAGFYRSRIKTASGPGHIAVTQFQESDARRAFPCFDHPAQKAVFSVEMIIDSHLMAISNTDIREIEWQEDGRQRVRFHSTPKMSTYLLFFGVGPFEIHEDAEDRRLRAVCLPEMGDQTQFGREFGRKALAYGEDFYGIDYPLTKLDLIAVPDFAFGAMENWGAITFRENLLLVVPGVTSREALVRICEVIAHEIAHQWFGNLVTPEEWKYLWLNESFATYFGYGMVHHHHAEWDIWQQFVRSQTEVALTRDALHETFAIEMPGDAQVAITTSTAPIIYSKGGSILRQLEAWIGPDHFKAGLRRYLTDFAYGCAASHHLWESLSTASGMPVSELMRNWVTQPGFPLIRVERGQDKLNLRQERFTYLAEDFSQTWMVPVSITTYAADGTTDTRTVLLDSQDAEIDLPADTRAYQLNSGQSGFYHVEYADAANLSRLGALVADKALSDLDRWGLQNDLFALVKAGRISMTAFLEMADNYQDECDYLPLSSLDSHLFEAHLTLQGDIRSRVTGTATALADNALAAIGFQPVPGEPQTTAMLRDQLFVHTALMGNSTVLAFLSEQFRGLINGIRIDPDIFRSVLTAGAVTGGQEALDAIFRLLESSEIEHERMTLAGALGAFSQWAQLEQALDYTLDRIPDRIRFIPLVAAAGNPAADRLWPWFEANLDRLEQMHPMLFERVVAAFVPGPGLNDPQRTRTFCKDLEKRSPRLKDVIALSLERLDVNHRFRQRGR